MGLRVTGLTLVTLTVCADALILRFNMLDFKKIEITDIDTIKQIIEHSGELSCENSFVNLLVWQCAYNNEFAVKNGSLFIKSGEAPNETYRIPIGSDLDAAMELLKEHTKSETVKFWIQEGPLYKRFAEKFPQNYVFREHRNAFDYIYLRDDLANLAGKKYHSKRNHISAFSKKYDWHYESITPQNIEKVKICANKWYSQNAKKIDSFMECEKQGVNLLLDNFERLALKGGAILVRGEVVAFTLGSRINGEIFDIHIEKALPEFAESYTVINREFAKNELAEYKYINREDDMGLEGLRKAKLSYKPNILLKKFSCISKERYEEEKRQCREIYDEAFYDDNNFADKLFETCFKHCKYLSQGGKIVSILFALPCEMEFEGEKHSATYIFAAATKKEFQNKGYMGRLLKETVKNSGGACFLRPATKELVQYYERKGFAVKLGVNDILQECNILPSEEFSTLASENLKKEETEKFTLMFYRGEDLPFDNVGFEFSME